MTRPRRISKYAILEDKESLLYKYNIEKLSIYEIARQENIPTVASVAKALIRYGQPIRRLRPPRVSGRSFFPLLNNPDWLKSQYIDLKKSTIEIAILAGCKSCASVAKALRKYKIPVRDKSYGHRIKRTDYFINNLPVIEGSLLGDSSIPRTKSGNNSLVKHNIHYDHVLFFGQQIFQHNAEKRIKGPINTQNGICRFRGKIYKKTPFYSISSLRHPEIKALRDRWYLPTGEKIIPRDITFTKESLLHWFLDDGYSYYVTRFKNIPKYTKKIVRVQFSTQCFRKEDLDFLCKKIYDLFNLTITPRFHQRHKKHAGYGYFLELAQGQSKQFFDLIGPPPVKSLSYKWKSVDI